MNTHLLSPLLSSPTLAATAPWAGSGPATDGGPSGTAFTRALENARQASLTANDPPRPASPPPREAEATGRGERAERPDPARRAERGEPARSAERPENAEREARGPRDASDERRPRGAAGPRSTDTARRGQAQGTSRRDEIGTANASAVRGHRQGVEQGEEESTLPGGGPALRRSDATESENGGAAALAAEAAAALPPATEAGPAAPPRGMAQGSGSGAEAAIGETGAAGAARAAGRAARGTLDDAFSESGPGAPGGARGRGVNAHRGADDTASGVLDPSALGLRPVSATMAGATALPDDGGREPVAATSIQGGSSTSNTAALAAAWATPAAAADATATAGTVHEAGLKAAPGSEAFARELGAQVSVFVREGVQQARLHLNPQELGPVLVSIQLEGQAAQVHMAADLPQTRQALEQALPALAGQLSESGITLTGGGVFERPPQGFAEREARGDEGGRAAAFGGRAVDGSAPTAPLAAEPGRWSRARGLVDLIA